MFSQPNRLASVCRRWGTYFENAKAYPEPNNINNPEFCAVANFSQTFGTPTAWGWADSTCSNRFPFMCRNYSESLAVRLHVGRCPWPGMLPHALWPACLSPLAASHLTHHACAPAACGSFTYKSPMSGYTYILNSCPQTFEEAEERCMTRGAHLTTFNNLNEQVRARSGPRWMPMPVPMQPDA